jgi:hypothetical protein
VRPDQASFGYPQLTAGDPGLPLVLARIWHGDRVVQSWRGDSPAIGDVSVIGLHRDVVCRTLCLVVDWGDVPTWLAVAAGFGAGGVALWQLRLQRIQLADQTRIQERQQADAVDVAAGAVDGGKSWVLPSDKSEPVHLVIVTNGSKRPIREVACKMEAIQTDSTIRHDKLADVYGEMREVGLGSKASVETFEPQAHASTMPVLRAGHKAGFAWAFAAARYPRFLSWVRFTDDAGLHWQVTTDLHLEKLANRDW